LYTELEKIKSLHMDKALQNILLREYRAREHPSTWTQSYRTSLYLDTELEIILPIGDRAREHLSTWILG
jgi:hypothetical protein